MGVGERRGGRRAGRRRRANHRRNQHRNHQRHQRRHHNGGRGAAFFIFRSKNRTGDASNTGTTGGTGTAPRSYPLVNLFSIIGFVCFGTGMGMAAIGGWTSSAIGIVGIVILSLSAVIIAITMFIRCHIMKNLPSNAGRDLEAGTVNPSMTVSTVTLDGGSTTASQVQEMASYIIQTAAMQPGGVAMRAQGHGTQPGYPGGSTQPYSQPSQNYAGASMPYPQPDAPPINYTALYPAQSPPSDNQVVEVDSNSEVDSIPPPPSYNDVMTGSTKFDEKNGPT